MSSGALAGASMAGSAVSAYGQLQSSQAASTAANYNAQVAENNAGISTQQAMWVGQKGVQAASNSQMKTAATVGSIKANQGASGVEIGTGSNADVVTSAREVGMLDALTIRSNAAREAYGYQTQAVSEKAQAQLDRFAAKNDISAGKINAATTLLGGAAKAAQYMNFQQGNSVLNTNA